MDSDLDVLSREALLAEVKKLRAAIRRHRDSSGHALCWYHPQLWSLLPEQVEPSPASVPDWPQFMRGCVNYSTPSAPTLRVATRSFEACCFCHLRRRQNAARRALVPASAGAGVAAHSGGA